MPRPRGRAALPDATEPQAVLPATTEPTQPTAEPAPQPTGEPTPPATKPAPSGRPVAVRLSDASRRFGETVAVHGIDLEIPAGTVVGVVGPSGSGKTTTIRMITGSIAPTGGRVEVLGEAPSAFRRRTRERIGYMPQKFSLYPELSVLENVDFAASLYGLLLWRRWRRRREVLELVELWDVRGRRARDLSGGMQRRLELACTLVHEPDLLVLDEPTAGLDPILRRTVWDEVHRLRERGVTAIVTTQYVTEAEECDAVVLIVEGRALAIGTPDELRRLALGGEEVEVTTREVVDGAALEGSPGMLAVHQTGARELRLIVDDAGTASQAVPDILAARGVEVVSVREYRPSFEEVFAELVRRDEAERTRAAEGDVSGAPDDGAATGAATEGARQERAA